MLPKVQQRTGPPSGSPIAAIGKYAQYNCRFMLSFFRNGWANFLPGITEYVSSCRPVNPLDRLPGHGTGHFKVKKKKEKKRVEETEPVRFSTFNPYTFAGDNTPCLHNSALAQRFDPGESSGLKHPVDTKSHYLDPSRAEGARRTHSGAPTFAHNKHSGPKTAQKKRKQ